MDNTGIKIGTVLLHKRSGALAWCLTWPMRFIDPDPWVRKNFNLWGRYWHMSFVCGWNKEKQDWIVRSVEGRGIAYRLLSEFNPAPTPVNWAFDVEEHEVQDYCATHPAKGYDAIGYIQCAANRITRGVIPAVRNRFLYCWEDVSMFCEWASRGWMPYAEMPYMPVFLKEVLHWKD
jgi:hypothetical protein